MCVDGAILQVFHAGNDSVTLTAYNQIDFSLVTTGGGEGVDVNWSGLWLYLDLKVNGAYVPSKIFTGAAAKQTAIVSRTVIELFFMAPYFVEKLLFILRLSTNSKPNNKLQTRAERSGSSY